MPSFDEVNGELGDYEDQFEDEYGDVEAGEYEGDEEEEEEEEEPLSEEALKLRKYRQALKEQTRSKLRQEYVTSLSISPDNKMKPALKKFGSFFGPSKPVIANRVIQESKTLFENPRFAPKASDFEKDAKTGSISCPGPKNGTNCQSPLNQTKTKAQILKNSRDYSFLLSDDAEIPKPANDPNKQNSLVPKPDGRPFLAPAKSNEPLDANKRKKPLVTPWKLMSGTVARPATPKALPPKRPLSSSGKKVPVTVGDKIPLASKNSLSNGQRPLFKSQTSGVSNLMEHNVLKKKIAGRNELKKKIAGASKLQNKLPNQSSVQANGLMKKQKSGVQSVHEYSDKTEKKRKAEELSDDDFHDISSIICNPELIWASTSI